VNVSEQRKSGARGFALVLGAMLAIMAVLWLIATLLAP
jgi:preprotein translocase subunit SecG